MAMTAECARPAELGARIRERAAAILDLNQRRLSLDWLKEYPLPKLREACGRMAGEVPEDAEAGLHVQRELIRNPAFARYLARLLPLLPEEAPLEPPKPVAGRYGQPAPKAAPSRRGKLMHRLDGLGRLIYLENFVSRALDHEQRGRAINSLRQCVGVPAALTREQQDQLKLKKTNQDKWEKSTAEERAEMDKALRSAKNEMFTHPYYAPCNSQFKCLHYCRYADDFIVSVIGSKADAEQLKAKIKTFLEKELKLEMSEEKTKVTHSSDFARFLGYDLCISRSNAIKYNKDGVAKREYSGRVMMYVPKEKWMGKLQQYHTFKIKLDEQGKEKWKTIHRGKLINHPDIEIITKVNAEIRGMYNYYQLANNVSVLNKFAYIMIESMYKTFACKYRSTVKKIVAKYSRNGVFSVPYETKGGKKYCEIYHDGFKRKKEVRLDVDTLPEYRKSFHPRSNAARLIRGICELCGRHTSDIRMHHVRKLKDLTGDTDWEKLMRKMRRKSLAVCKDCHEKIHA